MANIDMYIMNTDQETYINANMQAIVGFMRD